MKKLCLLIFLTITSFSYTQNDYLLGESYYNEGAYKKATEIFKNLYYKSEFNTTYLSRLISCYQETQQFLEAEKLLKSKLKKNPHESYLYVYLGYNYELQQRFKLAKKNYDFALASIDRKNIYGGTIGFIFKNYGLLDNAILAYEKVMAKNKNANYNIQIAQIYGEKGALKKMFEFYIELLDKKEEKLDLVQRYTSKYITDDDENEANIIFRKTLLRKSASNPKDVWNILLSWLFTRQKNYQKALTQEKALYQRNPTDLSAIYSLGKIAFENKNYTTAKECFSFITQNTTLKEEKIEAFLFLTKISAASNIPETEKLFQSLFNEFGKNKLTIKLQVAYADFLTFQQNKPYEAIDVLENAMGFSHSKFDKARIKLKLGDILVFIGKYNKALRYFSQIQTQLKNHELAQKARFKVAQTSYFKGDFPWAKAQLKVLKSATTQLIANDALALFLIITDNEPVDGIPSGLIQYSKAALLTFQNKTQQAIDTLSVVTKNFKGQPIEDEALFEQAKLFLKINQYEAAIINFEKIISLNPAGILIDDAYYELAELYKNYLKSPEKASEYYQKIIFEHSSSIYLVDARKKYRTIRGDEI